MSTPYETSTIAGLTVKLYTDDDPMNCRHDCDNPAVMVCWHRRYDLGDKKAKWAEQWAGPQEFLEWAKANKIKWLPLYLYDHSGLTMSTGAFSCKWDSGQVGFIYWDPAQVKACCGEDAMRWPKKKIEKDMRVQVEEYDKYLRGDVYGYVVEDENGEKLDSCWGFYGLDYARGEAKSSAESQAANRAAEAKKLATMYRTTWAD